MNKKLGFYSLLIAGFIYGTFPLLIRLVSSMFGPFTQIGLRAIIAIAIVSVILIKNKASLSIRHIQPIILILFCIAFPIDVIFYVSSILLGKATNAIFLLFAVSLLFSLVTGIIFFKEKVTLQKIVAMLLLLVGLIFVTHPFDSQSLPLAVIFGLLAGFFDALTNLLRKHLGVTNRWVPLFYQYMTMGVISLLFARVSGEVMIKTISIIPITIILLYSIFNVVSASLLSVGFSNFDFHLGTIVLASELFFGAVLNAVILHEIPTLTEAFGEGIIFLAVLAANLWVPIARSSGSARSRRKG